MEAFLAFAVVFYQVSNFLNYWRTIVFWESYVENFVRKYSPFLDHQILISNDHTTHLLL